MGNQLARTTQVSSSEYYLQDLPSTYNLVLKEVLGKDRIFKSVQCVHDEGLLLVKVYFKRGEPGSEIKEYQLKLEDIRARLKSLEHSHVWPFKTFLETDKAAYLLRQYFFSNLHDRISTRPFLSIMEKRWLAFQLLFAAKQCHERGVCHGDIKCENVLVTSWNWVYLADFASWKPTYLPSDNPSDFSYFFDTGGRRRCYLAPERFYDTLASPDAPLNPPMDVFSIGCVIAELFLEGKALFDLSQLLAYRKGQYDPRPSLQKIPDEKVQEMILHMIQLSPHHRSSPHEYLVQWTPAVFPGYFAPLLHKFFSGLVPLDSDTRIAATQSAFGEIRKQMVDDAFDKGTQKLITKGQDRSILQEIGNAERSDGDGFSAFNGCLLADQGDITRRYAGTKYKAGGTVNRIKAAAAAMAQKQNPMTEPGQEVLQSREGYGAVLSGGAYGKGESAEAQGLNSLRRQKENVLFRLDGQGPDALLTFDGVLKSGVPSVDQQPNCEGMILIASLLCACLRNVRLPQARRTAIQLLHDASQFCDNDTRLQHILPYVVALLSDPAAIVRCAALQTLCNLLSLVQNFPPSDAKIFPEYILPLLSKLPDDPEESVRIAYADNIHKIARSSNRFLVTSQYFSESGDSPARPPKGTGRQLARHDVELSNLRESIARVIQELVMGQKQTPTIRRALLQHVGSLCHFFGPKQSNDFLLPILPAFLNDRDEQLRAIFFENIVHVCLFVGQASLEAYLLPYIEQALNDVEETVIVNALECLAALCVHNLLQKRIVLEGVERASPLLCHPSQWVRRAAVTFVAATSANIELVDSHAYLSPILSPFMRRDPASLCSENSILVCLKPPVSREVFNRVLSDVMLLQTLPETGSVKVRPKGRQRVAQIHPPSEHVTGQSRVSNPEKRKVEKELSGTLSVSELLVKNSVGKKFTGVTSAPVSNDVPFAGENEDGEKMRAMEGYIRNLSSTMQTRMHTWEAENSEKFESSTVGLPPGVGAGYYSHYDGSSEGIPLYSVPLADKKPEGTSGQGGLPLGSSSYSEDWSRVFGVRQTGAPFQMAPVGGSLGPASSQWATIGPHSSIPSGELMQQSIAAVPITPRFMAGSVYHGISATGPRRVYEVMKDGGREGEAVYFTPGQGQTPLDMGMPRVMGSLPTIEPIFEVYPAPDSVTALLGSVHLGQSGMESSWRPKGVLIAHLQEHHRAVNEVSVSSDQIFFVSGSDDGTVKVWDCRRLERDISFRSRLTYSFLNSRVLCVTMLSDGHHVAAAASSGAIHVIQVDYQARLGGSSERYSGFSDIRRLESDEGAVLCLQNFAAEGPPLLLYSTQRNGTHLWDLRSPNEAWVLRGKPAQGYISASALDPNCNWLTTGTSRGFVTLWDLRFQIPVNNWQHPLGCPVESMCPLLPRTGAMQSISARPFIYVAAGQDEVALWNAEDGQCHQVMRLAPDADTEPSEIPAALVQRASSVKSGSPVTSPTKQHSEAKSMDYRMDEFNEPPPRLSGVRALFPLANGSGLLSGGTDCRVRMWDRMRPEQSYTICGPSTKASEPVVYETSLMSGVRVIQEHSGIAKGSLMHGSKSPTSKNGLVASAQDSVGCHRDCVCSLASAQFNQKLLISSCRDGTIKVWK